MPGYAGGAWPCPSMHASQCCDALAGAGQIQDGFPTDRLLPKRGSMAIVYDAPTRMQKPNTTDAYPVILSSGDNKTYSFWYPFALPNVAVGDVVVVRSPRWDSLCVSNDAGKFTTGASRTHSVRCCVICIMHRCLVGLSCYASEQTVPSMCTAACLR